MAERPCSDGTSWGNALADSGPPRGAAVAAAAPGAASGAEHVTHVDHAHGCPLRALRNPGAVQEWQGYAPSRRVARVGSLRGLAHLCTALGNRGCWELRMHCPGGLWCRAAQCCSICITVVAVRPAAGGGGTCSGPPRPVIGLAGASVEVPCTLSIGVFSVYGCVVCVGALLRLTRARGPEAPLPDECRSHSL
jgi:hypothetical protein